MNSDERVDDIAEGPVVVASGRLFRDGPTDTSSSFASRITLRSKPSYLVSSAMRSHLQSIRLHTDTPPRQRGGGIAFKKKLCRRRKKNPWPCRETGRRHPNQSCLCYVATGVTDKQCKASCSCMEWWS